MGLSAQVITVSDRCFSGKREDISGPLAASELAKVGFEVAEVVVVPDEESQLQQALRAAVASGYRLIFTTGGTGVSPRDITPEVSREFIAAELPGIAEQIRAAGLAKAPAAMLSRGLAGITGRQAGASVIINAPGSPGGVRDSLAVLLPVIGHLIEQLDGGDH